MRTANPRTRSVILISCVAFIGLIANAMLATAQTLPAPGATVVPPCPSIAEQSRAIGEKRSDDTAVAAGRPAEQSIILPSAGEPPAKRDGDDVRAAIDCPMAPNHPNAIGPESANQPATAPVAAAASAAKLTLTAEQAKTWIGKPVYSSDDKKIGEVIALARGADNTVTELHAGIGGFLGLGETHVRVMPAQFKLMVDRVVLDVTSAQAKGLPNFVK